VVWTDVRQMKLVVDLLNNNTMSSAPDGPEMAQQDVWEWLQKVTHEFEALRAVNGKLAARVKELERMVEGASSMSDDELLAELPARMARALQSSQEVASEIVKRAHSREKEILQGAQEAASALAHRKDVEAAEVLRRATAEAQAYVAEARSDGEQIVADAHSEAKQMVAEARFQRDRILSALEEQRAELIEEIRALEAGRAHLLEAFASVRSTLEQDYSNGPGPSRREPAGSYGSSGPGPSPSDQMLSYGNGQGSARKEPIKRRRHQQVIARHPARRPG
jgi:cell division septum initiation protein DivIVA